MNIEHRTPNVEVKTKERVSGSVVALPIDAPACPRSMFNVRCWMFDVRPESPEAIRREHALANSRRRSQFWPSGQVGVGRVSSAPPVPFVLLVVSVLSLPARRRAFPAKDGKDEKDRKDRAPPEQSRQETGANKSMLPTSQGLGREIAALW